MGQNGGIESTYIVTAIVKRTLWGSEPRWLKWWGESLQEWQLECIINWTCMLGIKESVKYYRKTLRVTIWMAESFPKGLFWWGKMMDLVLDILLPSLNTCQWNSGPEYRLEIIDVGLNKHVAGWSYGHKWVCLETLLRMWRKEFGDFDEHQCSRLWQIRRTLPK